MCRPTLSLVKYLCYAKPKKYSIQYFYLNYFLKVYCRKHKSVFLYLIGMAISVISQKLVPCTSFWWSCMPTTGPLHHSGGDRHTPCPFAQRRCLNNIQMCLTDLVRMQPFHVWLVKWSLTFLCLTILFFKVGLRSWS